MQEYIKQAKKKGVEISEKGNCQFCGALVNNGITECMEIFANKVLLFEYNLPDIFQSTFLIVDSHALQHSEIHGKENNTLHLTRLHLILDKKITWDYRKTPLLSDFLNQYKIDGKIEHLIPPPKLERGKITVRDISSATSTEQYLGLVQIWAEQVYHSWQFHLTVVSDLADGFIKHLDNIRNQQITQRNQKIELNIKRVLEPWQINELMPKGNVVQTQLLPIFIPYWKLEMMIGSVAF